jgi:hypothetical protein
VEIILASGDYKISGNASARVEIRDPVADIIQGDLNNNHQLDIEDAIIALQICSGEPIATVFIELSITNNRIGLEDVIYILDEIAK